MPLLEELLRSVARRYRLPAAPSTLPRVAEAGAATTLAIVIEHAREAVVRGVAPDPALRRGFIRALARLIQEAMDTRSGDPAFQALVLRHRTGHVREYASLSANADRDSRRVRAAVNAIAHPAKQARTPRGRQREALERLHTLAASAAWSELATSARTLLAMPEMANPSPLEPALERLLNGPELDRLERLEALASDELVRRYRDLWDRQGPRSGSPGAAAQGSASRQRGAAVETLAAEALEALARRLNEQDEPRATYRTVTSLRVPASIPASAERAKSEWDAVLLKREKNRDAGTGWDICLLVEAKASVDAATTDLPRLLRGLHLLAHAEENVVYPFSGRQGTVHLRGASLRALTTDAGALALTVLYCCNAPAEAAPRLLSAASRMQLLTAPASLAFASALAEQRAAEPPILEAVWHPLLESPRWSAVLHQYPTLRQVRELMVHTEDLLAAINRMAEDNEPGGQPPVLT